MPFFYYPTKVILVDDNKHFLEAMRESLEEDIEYFSNPIEALEYINQQDFYIPELDISYDVNLTRLSSRFDLLEFNTKLLHKKRNSLSLVISDYDMPEMNGREFLSRILLPVKKIMLTAIMDSRSAIEIKGDEIDDYIDKNNNNLVTVLRNKIYKLQKLYFNRLVPSWLYHNSILCNAEFITYFDEVIKSNDINEYYLLDYTGSYLMIDKNDESFLFSCHNNEQSEDAINEYECDIQKKLETNIHQITELYNLQLILPVQGKLDKFFYKADKTIGEYSISFAKIDCKKPALI